MMAILFTLLFVAGGLAWYGQSNKAIYMLWVILALSTVVFLAHATHDLHLQL